MFITLQLGPSIMTTILILIGVMQGCTFIGSGIILLVLVKKLRDNSKSPKIMSSILQGHPTKIHKNIRNYSQFNRIT